jgi:organic radical activating enzyme
MIRKKQYFKDLDFSVGKNNKSVQKNTDNLEVLKKGLHSHSSCLCLAKFTQVTMHLGSGLVHSCHHPRVHKIPLEEIQKNPAALFNTNHLQQSRTQMLKGHRPLECDYCWRIEDSGENSDRFYKSLEDWALESYDEIVDAQGTEIFKPKYLEVSFGNACNMQCTYCGPEFSSKWVEDLKDKGPVKIIDKDEGQQWIQGWQNLDQISIPNRDYNPYIDAFWKWFPEIYPELHHFRITGGEPILNKNTMKALDYVLENPRDNLNISINSNLSVTDQVWEKFIKKIKQLETCANFKNITIFVSIESWKEQAEYARTGIEFDKLQKRVYQLLDNTSVSCTFMSTYNMFAITSFKEILKWIKELKTNYNSNPRLYEEAKNRKDDLTLLPRTFRRVGIDIPYLRHPEFLDIQYCTEELFYTYVQPCLKYLEDNMSNNSDYINAHLGFEPAEVDRFRRIVNDVGMFIKNKNTSEKVTHNRAKFYDFVSQMDIRRGTNFLQTFPEMRNYYMLCNKEKESIVKKMDKLY